MNPQVSNLREQMEHLPFVMLKIAEGEDSSVLAFSKLQASQVRDIVTRMRHSNLKSFGTFVMFFNGQNSKMVRINAQVKVRRDSTPSKRPEPEVAEEKAASPIVPVHASPRKVSFAADEPEEQEELDPEEQEDQLLDKALAKLAEKESRPKEKVLQHAVESKSTLQQMLNAPYQPPCMVYERAVQVAKRSTIPARATAPAKIEIANIQDATRAIEHNK